MSIPLENLDNKTYDELVRDALARIPIYAPNWTDRNETDPGVTFLELFAWLADMQIYSLNRISDKSRLKFLKLLGVPRPHPAIPAEVYLDFTPAEEAAKAVVPRGTRVFSRGPGSGDYVYFETDDKGTLAAATVHAVQGRTLTKTFTSDGSAGFQAQLQDRLVLQEYVLKVSVNNETWRLVDNLDEAKYDDKSYEADFKNGFILFGDGHLASQSGHGKVPDAGAKIEIYYRAEAGFVTRELISDGSADLRIDLTDAARDLTLDSFFIEVWVNGEKWAQESDFSDFPDSKIWILKDSITDDSWNVVPNPQVIESGDEIEIFYLKEMGIAIKRYSCSDSAVYSIPGLSKVLNIRSGGGNWRFSNKEDLTQLGPWDEVYTAHTDENGWKIVFGNGANGKVPPEQAIIAARYSCNGNSFIRKCLSSGAQLFRLDLGNIPASNESITVKVGDAFWRYVEASSSPWHAGRGADEEIFTISDNKVMFGSGTEGKVPPEGAMIEIGMSDDADYKDDFFSMLMTSPGRPNLSLPLAGDESLPESEKWWAGDWQSLGFLSEVKISETVWRAVDSLSNAGPNDPYFIVDKFRGIIAFGDGTHGKVPPKGHLLTIRYMCKHGFITREIISSGEKELRVELLDGPDKLSLEDVLKVRVGGDPWFYAEDLDASQSEDNDFTADPESGIINFGDGIRGKVPEKDLPIEVTYRTGVGSQGNLAAHTLKWIEADPADPAALSVDNQAAASGGRDGETLDEAIGRARNDLMEVTRAVTSSDYESLAMQCPMVNLARAKALARFHPSLGSNISNLISVAIVPYRSYDESGSSDPPLPLKTELDRVRRFLEQFRTVGTDLYVISPSYCKVRISAEVVRDPRYVQDSVENKVRKALANFLNPLIGGPEGGGWPFGRPVYLSEIMQVIDQVEGVDHVSRATIQRQIGANEWLDEASGRLHIPAHGLVCSDCSEDGGENGDHIINAAQVMQ